MSLPSKETNRESDFGRIIAEKLQDNSEANIIICGDFNDFPGKDEQEEAAGVEDLTVKMMKTIVLDDGTEAHMYSPTLEESDLDENSELWTERTDTYGSVLFDYFFLTEGAREEFAGIDHVYPEEFEDIGEASDYLLVLLDMGVK